jgi:putative DNA primase/helicase
MSLSHIVDACQSACESVGIIYKQFPPDGKFHVVDAIEGKPRNGAGRIKFFSDGQGGIAWNWKTGQQQAFFVNGRQGELTPPAELERIKREQQRRAAETLKSQDKAARRAVAIWQAARRAPLVDHPYLITKQIKPHGARLGSWQRTIEDENGKRQKLIM